MPLRTETRTRSSLMSGRAPLMACTRMTMRSLRSRSSRVSTKPDKVTLKAGAARIGWAMRAVFQAASVKPNAIAAAATATGNASGRARAAMHNDIAAAVSVMPAHRNGSRSAEKYRTTPSPNATGSHGMSRPGAVSRAIQPPTWAPARCRSGDSMSGQPGEPARVRFPSGHVPARAPLRVSAPPRLLGSPSPAMSPRPRHSTGS